MPAPVERCPKCGDEQRGRWHKAYCCVYGCPMRYDGKEHWYYVCDCGYEWATPLDAERDKGIPDSWLPRSPQE